MLIGRNRRAPRGRARLAGAVAALAVLLVAPAACRRSTRHVAADSAAAPERPRARLPGAGATREPTRGPLAVDPRNPRWFADRTGHAVLLVGAHTWNNLQDMTPEPLDYDVYLDRLRDLNHNFFRLWVMENAVDYDTLHEIVPLRHLRTGPGLALDGKPRFDLTRLDDRYFARLRARVLAAGERGFYVSVMLFNGFQLGVRARGQKVNPWRTHPFNAANNVNGIDGDPDGDQYGDLVHQLDDPAIVALEEAYVRKVIDTVGDLDNVLYEISNESTGRSTRWQYHFIDYIHAYEAARKYRHPVGMTFEYDRERPGTNDDLFESRAEWISPNRAAPAGHDYLDDPPPSDARKVTVLDTDHLCGVCGSVDWAWKAFTRGHNLLYMDPYDGRVLARPRVPGLVEALGDIRLIAGSVELASMTPHGELSSTGYCLAWEAHDYIVFAPEGGELRVDLRGLAGQRATGTWLRAATGEKGEPFVVSGGDLTTFAAPFRGAAVLLLRATP